jgi:hypothetical protein
MSKFKRAKKLIGKNIVNDFFGLCKIIDVVYVAPGSDLARFHIVHGPGLFFKTNPVAKAGSKLESVKKTLSFQKEHLDEVRTFQKYNVECNRYGYANWKEVISEMEKDVKLLEDTINHPDIDFTFIKVNSRVRYQIIE